MIVKNRRADPCEFFPASGSPQTRGKQPKLIVAARAPGNSAAWWRNWAWWDQFGRGLRHGHG
jgi:hypothetical protein